MDIFEGRQAIRERLLSDAIHRMKNVMGGISGFASLLLKDLDEHSSSYPLVERIQENVFRLDQFIVDVMTLVRDRTLHLESIDLPSTIRDVCVNYYDDLENENNGFPFKIKTSHSKISVKADPLLIRNGFYHALRFADLVSKKIDSIEIQFQESAIAVYFLFLSEESLELFTKDILAGLGGLESIDAKLSLAVCLKLMRLHGGEVVVNHRSGNRWVLIVQLGKESN